MIEEIQSFFSEVSKGNELDDSVDTLIYIFVELGWTQKDFEEAEIPFIISYLNKRAKVLKEQERQAKKRR